MARLVRFLRRSVGEIRHSVKTYIKKSIVVPCQACSNHVHIRVMDFLAEPEKPMEIKCTKCNHTVCFTSKQPTARRMSARYTTGSPYPGWDTAYNGPPSLGTRAIHSQVDCNIDSGFRRNLAADSNQSVPYTILASQKPESLSITSKPKQDITNKRSSAISSDNFRTFYGGQNSTSNDGSNEYSDQDSVVGQSYSLRSSISLARRPSLPQPNTMLGLDECWEKTGGSNASWSASVIPTWLRSASPQPTTAPPSLSGSHRLSSSREKDWKRDEVLTPSEPGGHEDGHNLGFSLNHRESRDSIDLTLGKVEMKSYEGKDSDHLAQLRLFAVDFEAGKHIEPAPPASDSDRGSIRGSISEKRRGKLPQRSNAILHRTAVSRRHSQKIEQQEQQHEAEILSAKRRNSINSDFEVEPSDEQVRQAQKIYTDAKQQRLPYQDIDIQWARGILRARKNWEVLRYEHPLIGSMEHLQSKSRNSVEPAIPPYFPEAIRPPIPFAVSSPPSMSPRISRLSLQPLTTPVKEEPEGDIQIQGLVKDFLPSSSEPPGSTTSPPNSLKTSSTRPEETEAPVNKPVSIPTTGEAGPDNSCGRERLYISSTDSRKTSLLGYKDINTRCRKAFKNISRRVSYFRRTSTLSPQPPPPPPPPPISQLQLISTSRVATTPDLEVVLTEESRLSGEIHHVPTSEEPFRLVGNRIATLVESMRIPFVEIEVQARFEHLFPR